MTKGEMMCENNSNDARAAKDLARRIAFDDLALRYSTSLEMAGKLTRSNVRMDQASSYPKHDFEAREAMARQHDGWPSQENTVAMETDYDGEHEEFGNDSARHARHSPTREEPYLPRLPPHTEHSPVPPLLQVSRHSPPYLSNPTPPVEAYRNLQRHSIPFVTWPYYLASYPSYFSTMRMFPQYPLVYSNSQTVPGEAHDLPQRTASFSSRGVEPTELHAPNHVNKRLVVLPQGRALFSVKKTVDTDDLRTENSFQTYQEETDNSERHTADLLARESRYELDQRDDDVIVRNSTRPSVLVMQRASPSSTSNSFETTTSSPRAFSDHENDEHRACNDDQDTTDSDSSVSLPGSPRSRDSHTVESDEHSVSDVRRMRSSINIEKPHQCHICNRAFRKHSALIIHHRVHSGEKPYRCSECSKKFSISGNLRRHQLIHTGERPYICAVCSRAFNNPSHLTRHRRKLHGTRNDAQK